MELPQHHYFDMCKLFTSDNISRDPQAKLKFVDGAVDAVTYVMNELDFYRTETKVMREYMKNETYDKRISQILKETGLGE